MLSRAVQRVEQKFCQSLIVLVSLFTQHTDGYKTHSEKQPISSSVSLVSANKAVSGCLEWLFPGL